MMIIRHSHSMCGGIQCLKTLLIAVGLLFTSAPCYSADPPPTPRIWAEVEYLGWWTKGRDLPPLVTTSPIGTPFAQSGVLGQPTTQVLYGGNTVGDDMQNGKRLSIG